MKKYFIILLFFAGSYNLYAQQNNDLNAIKLFNNPDYVQNENADLPAGTADRLYRKITQLINQTGVAEIGYSTFFIAPKLDVLSVSEDNAGISKVYLADCELYLSINRVTMNENSIGGATFNSITKKITGSAMNKNEAIVNALNNISPNDPDIIRFLNDSKKKIDAYFKTNCDDVIKQAERALKVDDYKQAISLFFSVPSSAPCYNHALQRSEGVYAKYVEDECNKKIMKLQGFAALAQTRSSYYDSAMNVIEDLSPASDACNDQARQIIAKLEKNLGEQEKQRWDLEKQKLSDKTEVQKEMFKAMAEINKNYQPPSGTNVIIAH